MNKIIINIKSITYAFKAQKLLEKKGIVSYIKKADIPDENAGCGYSLFVAQKNSSAVEILKQYGIPISSVRNGCDS